jgi:hypothetical protein
MSTNEIQRIFDLLGDIQKDTATLVAQRAIDQKEIDTLREEVKELRSWRDQMIGRVAVVSISASFLFGLLGAWISSLWKK